MRYNRIKTPVRRKTRDAIVERLRAYDPVVEIGVGRQVAVAEALVAAGVDVTATDIVECAVPPGVVFRRDDVTTPTVSLYRHADAVYGLNLPPELHRPTWKLAQRVGATFLFTTLGGDSVSVPATPTTIPGDTLFTADPERA